MYLVTEYGLVFNQDQTQLVADANRRFVLFVLLDIPDNS